MGRCQSGRMSTIGNRVYVKSVPRVRIPPCPLQINHMAPRLIPVGPLVFGEICLRERAQGSPLAYTFCVRKCIAQSMLQRDKRTLGIHHMATSRCNLFHPHSPQTRKKPAPPGECGDAGSESSGGSKPEPCEKSRVTSGGRPHRRAPQAAPCSWRRSSRERRHRSAGPPRWCGSHQHSCGSAWSR